MDYFQGVVTEYLRAKREVFVNTEFLIQLDPGDVQVKGRSWYCDAVAVSFRDSAVYLCEITYSSSMHALITRVQDWEVHWAELCTAVRRDSGIPKEWHFQPWIFIPEKYHPVFWKKFALLTPAVGTTIHMPKPHETYLESVVPWKYRTWDRKVDVLEDDA